MNFKHLILLFLSISLNPIGQGFKGNRLPTHYVPDLEIRYQKSRSPAQLQHEGHRTLERAKQTLTGWEKTEELLLHYDLDQIHGQMTTNQATKRVLVEKSFLRYLDKSLSHKAKRAKKGSALATVRSTQKSLSPKIEASVFPGLKLKFRAKVLRGFGQIRFINPYFDADARFTLSGRQELNFHKYFDTIALRANMTYELNAKEWRTQVSKEISSHWQGRLSVFHRNGTSLLESPTERRLEVIYSLPF